MSVEVNVLASLLKHMPPTFRVADDQPTKLTHPTVRIVDAGGREILVTVTEELSDRSSFSPTPSGRFRLSATPWASRYEKQKTAYYLKSHGAVDAAKGAKFWSHCAAPACDAQETATARDTRARERVAKIEEDFDEVIRQTVIDKNSAYASPCSKGYFRGQTWIDALNVHFKSLTKEQAVAVILAAKAAGVDVG